MKYNHSLRNRILIAFCVFGFILSMIYWLLIDISMNHVEDMVFENRLQSEIKDYLDRYQNSSDARLPNSRYIKSYRGLAGMPAHLRKMVENLPEGYYETDGVGAIEGNGDYHVAVNRLPDRDELFYLFYDVGNLKVNEKYQSIVSTVLFLTSLIVTGIGGIIGVFITRKVIAPVTELADHVARSGPENLPVELSARFADDEIGFLAKNLEQSMQRIQAFIQREKNFTRDASHELRTPVTVIKGAIELITQLPAYQEESLQRLINRITRSIKGMALTIDTFLWLAREDLKNDIEPTCDVLAEVREAITEHQHLFKQKRIAFELCENDAPTIAAPAAVLRIVINNLLRNAFYHTPQGKVRLTVRTTGLELFNTGIFNNDTHIKSILHHHAPGKESNGFGFGLDIVKRLGERFGWRLDIKTESEGGTLVTLTFSV